MPPAFSSLEFMINGCGNMRKRTRVVPQCRYTAMELCLLVTVWILMKPQGVDLCKLARYPYGTMLVHFRKQTLGTYPCSFGKEWTCTHAASQFSIASGTLWNLGNVGAHRSVVMQHCVYPYEVLIVSNRISAAHHQCTWPRFCKCMFCKIQATWKFCLLVIDDD